MGNIVWMLRKGDFCFFFYMFVIYYILLCHKNTALNTYFFQSFWGGAQGKRHWHQTISQLALLFTYKAPGRPNDLIYNYVL